jgi:hypothetical protein
MIAPANEAVKWEEKVFVDMPGEVSPYLGDPSDEIDELWDQLYTDTYPKPTLRDLLLTRTGTGFLLFNPEETRRMAEPTVAIPTAEGVSGLYGMEVFHELHCLVCLSRMIMDCSVLTVSRRTCCANPCIRNDIPTINCGTRTEPKITIWRSI